MLTQNIKKSLPLSLRKRLLLWGATSVLMCLNLGCRDGANYGLANPGNSRSEDNENTTMDSGNVSEDATRSASVDFERNRLRCDCEKLMAPSFRKAFSETSASKSPELECTYQLPSKDSQSFMAVSLYRNLSMDDYRLLVENSFAIQIDDLNQSSLRLPFVLQEHDSKLLSKKVAHRLHETSMAAIIKVQWSQSSFEANKENNPSPESIQFLFHASDRIQNACR